jgi:hypothetical protein
MGQLITLKIFWDIQDEINLLGTNQLQRVGTTRSILTWPGNFG